MEKNENDYKTVFISIGILICIIVINFFIAKSIVKEFNNIENTQYGKK